MQLVAYDVHQVRRIAAVEYAEARIESHRRAVAADQPIGDRMKRTRPGQLHRRCRARARCLAIRLLLQHSRDDALRTARHLLRGPARECKQQNALRAHALQHQVRDAMRERIGLTGAGAGDDQQRTGAKFGVIPTLAEACSGELRRVEAFENRYRRHGVNYRTLLDVYPDLWCEATGVRREAQGENWD